MKPVARKTLLVALLAVLGMLAVSCRPAAAPTPTSRPAAPPTPTATPPPAPTPTLAAPTAPAPGAPALPPQVEKVVKELNIPLFLPGPDPRTPKYGGTVNIRGLEPKSWDIHQYVSYRLRITNSYTHERLMRFDAGPGKSPTVHIPVPALAESWDIKDGGKTIVFHIRKGVKWHNKPPVNGRELKASDFIFTLDRIKRNERATYQNSVLRKVESYEAPDDYTLIFHLKAPAASFLYELARTGMEVLPPEAEKVCGDFVKPECANIGTGPWMFVSWSPGSNTVMKRNPDYWDKPRPYIDEVRQLFFGDEKAEDAAFRTGKLDLLGVETDGISGERYRALKTSNPDSLYPAFIDPFNRRALWMRSDKPPFNDVRVRWAASMAIDRTGWVKSVLGGYGIPMGGHLYPGSPYWLPDEEYGECARYLQYNPNEAKRLLREAGYDTKQKFTLQSTTGYGERYSSETELVAQALNSIGITTEISMVDYDSFIPAWREGKWDYLMYFWYGYGYDPNDWFYIPFHSQMDGKRVFHIDDPKLDAMLDAQNVELDLQKRIRLVQDIAKYVACQAYVVPGPAWLYFYAQNPRLKNYTYHDSFDNGHPLIYAWIEP